MVIKKTETLPRERIASNSLFCIEHRIQWLPGCPLCVVRWVCWRLTQCYSKTRKSSVTQCLFSWWARPCDVECCSSSASIHPCQVPMTQDTVPALRLDKRAYRNMWACRKRACTESKLSTALCQHYTTAFSLCAFFALWAVLNHVWWLAVCGYKQKSHSCFSLGTTLKGYWLIHHSLNMDFFFLAGAKFK